MVVEIVGGFVVLVVTVLFVAYVISVYNQLVSLRRRVDQAKQNIDVLLKQRQDELTKLVDAVAEYMDHEDELLTTLTVAREQAERADSPRQEATADHMVREAMADFQARVEAYPELRSQENMRQFQNRISDLETQIADRRELYNEIVTEYNTRIEQFPYVVFALQFGFEERELFEAAPGELEDVDVGEVFDRTAA